MIKILELFGGIGSPRIALRNIGIPVKSIDYVEIDEKAVRSYNAMFKKELEYKTQSVVNWNLKPDILIHGSPCQDFSIAGKQKGASPGSETRSSLMWETIKIIEQMGRWKPKYVIWENVKNVLSKHMVCNFNTYLKQMEKMGYSNSFKVLDARDFGLPQARQRVFTISILNEDPFDFDLLEKKEMQDIKGFLSSYEDRHIVKQPSMLNLINNTSNSTFNGRVSVIDKYAYTITTKQMRSPNSGVIQIDDDSYRYLTELECWRLQGYDDNDFFAAEQVHASRINCLNGALYKQAGNSIPVTVLESIFKVITKNI